MKVTVVGGGRMGLPLACEFARNGAKVIVSDIDEALVESINSGKAPYEEPGLGEVMASLRGSGRLVGSVDTAAATNRSDVIVIIVPAHLTEEREIDLSVLKAASREVGRGLRPGSLVVYETTVSIGSTRRELVPILEKESDLLAGSDFYVGYSPERVKANLVFSRLRETPKVVGGLNAVSGQRAVSFYKEFLRAPVDDVGSMEAAETTKLLGMLYRDVNIALANELASFCEALGVDFEAIRSAANRDGEARLLAPGIGVGGHCTPVYPYFLIREAQRLGLTQRISEAAREINDYQPARQVERVERVLGPLKSLRIHILGLGFRPGVKVEIFSPAFSLRDKLESLGAEVTIEDPYYSDSEMVNLGFKPGSVDGAVIVILNTAHPEFESPDFSSWRTKGVTAVLDGRNIWAQGNVESAGIEYFGIGRSARCERKHS